MNPQDDPTPYKLELTATHHATGYFSCRPEKTPAFEEMIAHLRKAPFDEFMHNQLLHHLSEMRPEEQYAFFENALAAKDLLLLAACLELDFMDQAPARMKKAFTQIRTEDLLSCTPLIIIKSKVAKNRKLHEKWISLFRDNILHHALLPKPGDLPFPFEPEKLETKFQNDSDIAAIHARHAGKRSPHSDALPHPSETVNKALDILNTLGILHGEEMRHESSLSPIALIRQWRMEIFVESGRQHYRLSGIQNSYGRGLSLDAARASNVMEVLERYAAFASFDRNGIKGYKTDDPLIFSSYASLAAKGRPALNPNALCLEVPYEDESLHWMEAPTTLQGKTEKIWIPAQIVFLFCNLDEPALFSGLGSTGLASGNTMAQAKVAALLEIIERDAEATTPFDYSQCFRAETNDPEISRLFDKYRQLGIDVMYQDLTGRFGIPCCKCFVQSQDGSIAKGMGAHLSAKRALISALTETPYPFPKGPPSLVGPAHLVMVPLENLPNYSTGQPETDLAILEEVLSENGLQPIYVDLTRKDTGIPVVRAIVPGLEIMADFDAFSRVSPRLFYNYLKMAKSIPSSL